MVQQNRFQILFRNSFWLIINAVIQAVVGLLANVVVARYLGVSGFGTYAIILSATAYISLLRSGLGTHLVRLVAQEQSSGTSKLYVPGILAAGVASGCIGFLTVVAVILLTGNSAIAIPAILIALGFATGVVGDVPVSLLAGLNRMQWRLSASAQSVLFVGLVLLMRASGDRLLGVALANALSAAVVVLAVLWMTGRTIHPRCRSDSLTRAGAMLIGASLLSAIGLLQMVHWSIDMYFLYRLASVTEVSLFAISLRFVTVFQPIPWVLVMAVLPTFSSLGASDRLGDLRQLFSSVLKYVVLIGIPVALLVFTLAPVLVRILYSTDFLPATGPIRVAGWAIPLLFAYWPSLNLLQALHEDRKIVIAYVIAILVQGGADLALIGRYGAIGAAWGMLLGEAFLFAMLSTFAIHKVGLPDVHMMVRVGGCGMVGGLIAIASDHYLANSLGAAAVVLTYVAILLVSGTIGGKELRMFGDLGRILVSKFTRVSK